MQLSIHFEGVDFTSTGDAPVDLNIQGLELAHDLFLILIKLLQ